MRVTAEELARKQREISVSEFFAKNRHLLGFDNPTRALLTAVKEAVDNSLDACEESGILPELAVEIVQKAEDRFIIRVALESTVYDTTRGGSSSRSRRVDVDCSFFSSSSPSPSPDDSPSSSCTNPYGVYYGWQRGAL